MARRAMKIAVRRSRESIKWSREVRERDGFTCRWPGCFYTDRSIPAHHINERSQRPDLKFTLSNGAAICPQHHDFLHHTVAGRQQAKALGLLGGETYEKAAKLAA